MISILMTAIYKLIDPRDPDKVPWYIGKSRNTTTRLRYHITKGHSKQMRDWVASLAADGVKPELIVFQECSDKEWAAVEIREIARARLLNPRLINIHNGGEAGPEHDTAVKSGKAAIRKSHITQRLTYWGTPRQREAARRGAKRLHELYPELVKQAAIKGLAVAATKQEAAIETRRRTWYGTERQCASASKAGKIRAAITNHIRWHLRRNIISAGCEHCR